MKSKTISDHELNCVSKKKKKLILSVNEKKNESVIEIEEEDDDQLKPTSRNYKIPLTKANLPIINEIFFLLLRESKLFIKKIPTIFLLLIIYIPFSAIIVRFSHNLKYDWQGALTRIASIAILIMLVSLSSAMGSIWAIKNECDITDKELDSGYYRHISYILTKHISDIWSYRILQVFTLSILVYASMGTTCDYWWDCSYKYFIFSMTLISVSVISSIFGILVYLVFPSSELFTQATTNLILCFNLLNGFFISPELFPNLKWIFNYSFIKHACEIIYINEFKDIQLKIEKENVTEIVDGTYFLKEQGYKQNGIEDSLFILQIYYIITLLCLIVFYYISKKIRKIK